MKGLVVWGRTRTEAKAKARRLLRHRGLSVGRVTLVPTERYEPVKAWFVEPSDKVKLPEPAMTTYIDAWNEFMYPEDEGK